MTKQVALGGNWSQGSSWQDGVVPASDPSLSVKIAPGVTSIADVGLHGADQPFVVGSISFAAAPAAPSTLQVTSPSALDTAFLQVRHLYGGAPGNQNQVMVGRTGIAFNPDAYETATLQIAGSAVNVHFVLTGGTGYHNYGAGEVDIGGGFPGSSFTFDGRGFQDTLRLDHPPIGFIYNEIDVAAFTSPFPLAPMSGAERIELGGVTFDAAEFIPYGLRNAGGTVETGAVLLLNHDQPVYTLLNVHAAGYGGSINGHFSVGTDPQTQLDYVQYSRV